jgi:phosphatidylglycerophosphatase A
MLHCQIRVISEESSPIILSVALISEAQRQKVVHVIAKQVVTCGGLGLLPKAPGTWTSAAALVFWMTLQFLSVSPLIYLALILILFFVGLWAVNVYEKATKSEDASEVTIDEWLGMGVACALVHIWWMGLVAFALFRFFDIVKPLGIKYFDNNYWEGWGVLMDDVVAGLYTTIVIGVLLWLIPFLGFPLG